MSYRTFSKNQTYSYADLINSRKIFHINKNIQYYKSFVESKKSNCDSTGDEYGDQCGEYSGENYKLNCTKFYNEQTCCDSVNNFNSHSIHRPSICLNFNYIRND